MVLKKKLWLVFLPLVAASCSGAAYSVWYFSEKDKVEVSNNVDVDVNGFVDVGDIKVYLKESPSSSGTLAGTDIDFSTLSELTSFSIYFEQQVITYDKFYVVWNYPNDSEFIDETFSNFTFEVSVKIIGPIRDLISVQNYSEETETDANIFNGTWNTGYIANDNGVDRYVFEPQFVFEYHEDTKPVSADAFKNLYNCATNQDSHIEVNFEVSYNVPIV